MASLKLLPVVAYFLTQQFASQDAVRDLLPKALVGWLPPLVALLVYLFVSKIEQGQTEQATLAIVGQEAPDFAIKLKDKETTLRQIIKESKRPVVLDFYQNFCPACGPAAQLVDRLAGDPKYKDKVTFILCNLQSLEDAQKYHKDKGLTGAALHGAAQPPQEYGLMYIPHKVLIDRDGKVVHNFKLSLPADLDAHLASTEPKKDQ